MGFNVTFVKGACFGSAFRQLHSELAQLKRPFPARMKGGVQSLFFWEKRP
jgi:hypothetical protein